jgi:hypothetical protein
MPKCPVCLAAHIAIGTGIGVSIATVQFLRAALLALCALLLIFAAVKHMRRFFFTVRSSAR